MKPLLAICTILLASCASSPSISQRDAVEAYIGKEMESLDFRADDDSRLIRESLIGYINYHIFRYGPGFFEKVRKLESVKAIKDLMVSEYGTTATDTGMTNNILSAWEGGNSYAPLRLQLWPKYQRYENDLFIVYVQKGTILNDNAERILGLLTEKWDACVAALELTQEEMDRLSGNLRLFDKGKIPLRVYDSISTLTFFRQGGGGINLKEDGLSGQYRIEMEPFKIPYFNILRVSILTHEIFHLVDFLLRIDVSGSANPSEAFQKYPTGPWIEGMACYFADRIENGFFHRNDLIYPIAGDVSTYITKLDRKLESIDAFTNGYPKETPKQMQIRYAHFQLFVQYLIESYGLQTIKQFLYHTIPADEAAFRKAFGKTLDEIDMEIKREYGLD